MRTKTMAMTKKMPNTYADLVRAFMPRPLHDDVDYRNALAILDSMAGFKMNADQDDYFDAVATFVEKYEAEHHAIEGATMTPIQLIRSLLEAHDMTASDLGRLLGDRSLGHRLLSGRRQLSKIPHSHTRRPLPSQPRGTLIDRPFGSVRNGHANHRNCSAAGNKLKPGVAKIVDELSDLTAATWHPATHTVCQTPPWPWPHCTRPSLAADLEAKAWPTPSNW